MSFWRVILSVIFPPFSVWDRGCGSILIVFILTLFGWVPGVIAALVILNNVNDKNNMNNNIEVYELGLMDYEKVLKIQTELLIKL